MTNFKKSLFIVSSLLITNAFASLVQASNEQAQTLDAQKIAAVVNKARKTFYIPGMSVGIVHKNKVVHLQGYGLKNMASQAKVDKNTLFRLASTSKAFTAASLAILVDDGKINWDDKVTDYLPEFRMSEHWVTGEFTLGDLLTHKSGLVSSAGDSMLWPEPSGFTREEIIHNLRYLTPEFSFRSTYAYSNLMYIVAGEVVARVSEQPWEDFVEQRIFKPLNMQCYAGNIPKVALTNVATPYGYRNNNIYPIPRNGIHGPMTVSAAAGGIVCNAYSMTKWLKMLLNEGMNENNEQIVSAKQLTSMWQSRTILPMAKREQARNKTHFRTYGYGWRKNDLLGYELISHTGTVSGMQAYVALIPELELGVVLLNNGSNSGARSAVMQSILRSFITPDSAEIDWVEDYRIERLEKRNEYNSKHKVPKGSGRVLLSNEAYTGHYKDAWYGTVIIEESEHGLRLKFPKMITLKGTLEPFDDHSFVVRWDNKNAAEDAFVHFKLDANGIVQLLRLYPFTLEKEVSHEYRDMNFTRQHTEQMNEFNINSK